jgi:hypothetical protein
MALIERRRAKDAVIIKAYQLIRIFKLYIFNAGKRLSKDCVCRLLLLRMELAGALSLFSHPAAAFSPALHKHVIMDRLVRW